MPGSERRLRNGTYPRLRHPRSVSVFDAFAELYWDAASFFFYDFGERKGAKSRLAIMHLRPRRWIHAEYRSRRNKGYSNRPSNTVFSGVMRDVAVVSWGCVS
jgi:hypothetical protein